MSTPTSPIAPKPHRRQHSIQWIDTPPPSSTGTQSWSTTPIASPTCTSTRSPPSFITPIKSRWGPGLLRTLSSGSMPFRRPSCGLRRRSMSASSFGSMGSSPTDTHPGTGPGPGGEKGQHDHEQKGGDSASMSGVTMTPSTCSSRPRRPALERRDPSFKIGSSYKKSARSRITEAFSDEEFQQRSARLSSAITALLAASNSTDKGKSIAIVEGGGEDGVSDEQVSPGARGSGTPTAQCDTSTALQLDEDQVRYYTKIQEALTRYKTEYEPLIFDRRRRSQKLESWLEDERVKPFLEVVNASLNSQTCTRFGDSNSGGDGNWMLSIIKGRMGMWRDVALKPAALLDQAALLVQNGATETADAANGSATVLDTLQSETASLIDLLNQVETQKNQDQDQRDIYTITDDHLQSMLPLMQRGMDVGTIYELWSSMQSEDEALKAWMRSVKRSMELLREAHGQVAN